MFDRLLPQQLDNDYRGHKVALWLSGLVVLLTENLCRKLCFVVLPIARIGTGSAPDFFINLAIVALMVGGILLSLRAKLPLVSVPWMRRPAP